MFSSQILKFRARKIGVQNRHKKESLPVDDSDSFRLDVKVTGETFPFVGLLDYSFPDVIVIFIVQPTLWSLFRRKRRLYSPGAASDR